MDLKPLAVSRLQPNYEEWLRQLDHELRIENFDNREPGTFTSHPESFSGLLLTGGGDIAPERYDTGGKEGYCTNIDLQRDEREFRMTGAALRAGIPILAICRGLQVLNVWSGGTLIADIPSATGIFMHKGNSDTRHNIHVVTDSGLAEITGLVSGTVNSSHHQAIGRLGKGLMVSAMSEDGIIEAIELKKGASFCLAVQWHPERMDFESPFSSGIGKAFVKSLRFSARN